MSKATLLHTDSGGNTLWKKVTKGKVQIYAKNKSGRLVTEPGVRTMMRRAKIQFRKIR